jgi:hypothetical protein
VPLKGNRRSEGGQGRSRTADLPLSARQQLAFGAALSLPGEAWRRTEMPENGGCCCIDRCTGPWIDLCDGTLGTPMPRPDQLAFVGPGIQPLTSSLPHTPRPSGTCRYARDMFATASSRHPAARRAVVARAERAFVAQLVTQQSSRLGLTRSSVLPGTISTSLDYVDEPLHRRALCIK